MRWSRTRGLVGAVAAATLLLTGCGGGDSAGDDERAATEQETTRRTSTSRRPPRTTSSTAPAPPPTTAPAPVTTAGAVPPATPPAPATTEEPAPAGDPRIAGVTAEQLHASWRPGCPVGPEDLRALTVTHVDFEGVQRTGTLVVRADWAVAVLGVFDRLLALGFPIERVEPVDVYGGSDDASMAANNTSAFNCRAVTGGSGWSRHAYGTAIDLNPRQNPYVTSSGTVLPPEGADYVDRSPRPGVIRRGDGVVEAFEAIGWRWGGDWSDPVDYQHFDTRP